jgi:hypothetical protein
MLTLPCQDPHCYFMAPYTNVLYINLNWLRGDNLTQTYMQEVSITCTHHIAHHIYTALPCIACCLLKSQSQSYVCGGLFVLQVKDLGCIFNNRWGDLELWVNIIMLFAKEEEMATNGLDAHVNNARQLTRHSPSVPCLCLCLALPAAPWCVCTCHAWLFPSPPPPRAVLCCAVQGSVQLLRESPVYYTIPLP